MIVVLLEAGERLVVANTLFRGFVGRLSVDEPT